MEKKFLISFGKFTCDHFQQGQYTQTHFDILNGFEIVLTRCKNCHKIVTFGARRLS